LAGLPLIENFDRALLNVVRAWDAIEKCESVRILMLERETERALPLAPDGLDTFVSDIGITRMHLEISKLVAVERGQAVPSKPAFDAFVRQIAQIVGHASARGDVDQHGKPSRFVSFIATLQGLLPPDVKDTRTLRKAETTSVAWTRRVARVIYRPRTK
jgi:hypothetical protein